MKIPSQLPEKFRLHCPYCCNNLHNLDDCSNFCNLTKLQKKQWVIKNSRCWRCGHSHQVAHCRLRVNCRAYKGKHLNALHDINTKTEELSKGEKSNAETLCGLVNVSTNIHYPDRKAATKYSSMSEKFSCGKVVFPWKLTLS